MQRAAAGAAISNRLTHSACGSWSRQQWRIVSRPARDVPHLTPVDSAAGGGGGDGGQASVDDEAATARAPASVAATAVARRRSVRPRRRAGATPVLWPAPATPPPAGRNKGRCGDGGGGPDGARACPRSRYGAVGCGWPLPVHAFASAPARAAPSTAAAGGGCRPPHRGDSGGDGGGGGRVDASTIPAMDAVAGVGASASARTVGALLPALAPRPPPTGRRRAVAAIATAAAARRPQPAADCPLPLLPPPSFFRSSRPLPPSLGPPPPCAPRRWQRWRVAVRP